MLKNHEVMDSEERITVFTDWNTVITVYIVTSETLKFCFYGILIINNECYSKQQQLFDLCNGDRVFSVK